MTKFYINNKCDGTFKIEKLSDGTYDVVKFSDDYKAGKAVNTTSLKTEKEAQLYKERAEEACKEGSKKLADDNHKRRNKAIRNYDGYYIARDYTGRYLVVSVSSNDVVLSTTSIGLAEEQERLHNIRYKNKGMFVKHPTKRDY